MARRLARPAAYRQEDMDIDMQRCGEPVEAATEVGARITSVSQFGDHCHELTLASSRDPDSVAARASCPHSAPCFGRPACLEHADFFLAIDFVLNLFYIYLCGLGFTANAPCSNDPAARRLYAMFRLSVCLQDLCASCAKRPMQQQCVHSQKVLLKIPQVLSCVATALLYES